MHSANSQFTIHDKDMRFIELAKYLEKLESTSSRIEITKILAELFKQADEGEIDKIVYLVLGRLAPSYKGIVFNLADKLVIQSIAKAFDKDIDQVKKLSKEKGDIGEVASLLSNSKLKKTTNQKVNQIYNQLLVVAELSGEGSVEAKVNGLAEILKSLDPLSAKYLARIPVGKLRLGFSDLTITDALSWMETGDKSLSKDLKKAYEVLPDIGLLAKHVKQMGAKKTALTIAPVVGVPVMPMLAQRVKSTAQMVEKMGKVSVEPKYDGLRVQIHFDNGKIHAFTRNLNDISLMFPELSKLGQVTSSKRLILDAEAVGLDENTKKMADFQTTMTRRRKHDIAGSATKIPLVFNIFDIIFKDNQSLITTVYSQRREILAKTIKETDSFKITPFITTSDPKKIDEKYKQYIAQGLEGIMVKKSDAIYKSGRTGFFWVKMKQAEGATGKLADTIDCVVMGFTSGQGKRTVFGIGQFLAGVKKGNKILTLTKVGTGLTDEQFQQLSKRLRLIKVDQRPDDYEVDKDLTPDFWVNPEVVVELAGDDLTKSPKHTSGYALRFPRLVKFRDDKSPVQATTVEEVEKIYKLQFK